MRRVVFLCAIAVAILLPGFTRRAHAQQAQAPVVAAPLSVMAVAAPRTIQVFLVPVPLTLRSDQPVTYAVTPTGGATIIPPLRGIVATGGRDARSVMIAASVPAGARAGLRTIGTVQFSQGSIMVPVPIALQVSQVRSATLRLAQQLFGVQPRDRAVVHYFVTNTGNAADTFDVTLDAPSHWAVAGASRRLALGLGETASGDATVTIPRAAEAGVFEVKLAVAAGARQVATAAAVVQLLEARTGRAALGPNVVVGMASVLNDSGRASPVVGIEVAGPVTDQVQAFGRLVQATNPATVDQRGLARVGYFVGAPFLTVAGREWQLTGGNTGRSFSDVTGMSAYGRGASLNWAGEGWSVASLLAAPLSVVPSGDSDGHLLGLRVGREVWRHSAVNATITDFRDPQFTERHLEAVGIGAVSPVFSGLSATGELAQRWFTGGDGLGWMTELKRQSPADFGLLRVVHSPGGSAAFAHARDEVSVTGSRIVGRRLSITAGAWTSDDDNAIFSRVHTQGWSFSPRYDLTPHTSLQLEARSNSFDATSSAGSLGNGETGVRIGVNAQLGTAFVSGAASVGSARQTAGVPAGPRIATSASRQSLSAAAGAATDRGTLEVTGSFDHSGTGVGLLPYAYVLGIRARGVSLGASSRSPMVNAEVQYYGWFGDRPAMVVARLGLNAPLPAGLTLTLDVERNPFVTGVATGAQWIPVVKVTRSMRLPVGILRPAAKGEVFEDFNGNGARDRGEPGMAGAVVRRGSETVVTDRSGRFQFYDRADTPVRLDETSLPTGVISNAATPTGAPPVRGIAIAVIRTAQVDVQLVPTADSSGRLPNLDLNGIPLQAFDSAGNGWTARTDAGGLAHFYALPLGRYRVQADVSGLREPVRLGPSPVFTVELQRVVPLQKVLLYARPIRMFDPGASRRRSDERTDRAPGL